MLSHAYVLKYTKYVCYLDSYSSYSLLTVICMILHVVLAEYVVCLNLMELLKILQGRTRAKEMMYFISCSSFLSKYVLLLTDQNMNVLVSSSK